MRLFSAERYEVIVYFNGPHTQWMHGQCYDNDTSVDAFPGIHESKESTRPEPHPTEILARKKFRTLHMAYSWARLKLRGLDHCGAEIYGPK